MELLIWAIIGPHCKTEIYVAICKMLLPLSFLGIIYVFWHLTSTIYCKYEFRYIPYKQFLKILNTTDAMAMSHVAWRLSFLVDPILWGEV